MGDVIPVNFNQKRFWQCGCGGVLWYLSGDGECTCVRCNCASDNLRVENIDLTSDDET